MNSATPLNIGCGQIDSGWHACALFQGEEEEYHALVPFAHDCLRCGEKSVHFLDPGLRQRTLDRLSQAPADVAGATSSGQLQAFTWQETYLHGGGFEPERMLQFIDDMMRRNRLRYPRTRLWANMDWSLSDAPGCEQLIEYESRLNSVIDRTRDIVICVYDTRKYGARMLMDVLRTHPMLVVGAEVRRNPLFISTDEFLSEYRQRRRT
jgi:hypothetical protein